MNNVRSDFDQQLHTLEREWRQVYTATLTARAHYNELLEQRAVQAAVLAVARQRMEHAEHSTAQTMAKIERLERRLLLVKDYL